MDVIINNPPAQTFSTQGYSAPGYAAPAPYGYAPGYQHHGPGLLLPLLLLGGFLFWRGKRRQQRRRQRFWGQGMPAAATPGNGPQTATQTQQGPQNSSDQGEWGQNWRQNFEQGRERFFGGGLFSNGSVADKLLGDKALDIARQRYARGEIDADQYAELQRNLSKENEG